MLSRTAKSTMMPLVRRGGGTNASGVLPGVGGRRSSLRVPALKWGMCRASHTCACSQCGSSVRRAESDGSAYRVPVGVMRYNVATSWGDGGRIHLTLWLSLRFHFVRWWKSLQNHFGKINFIPSRGAFGHRGLAGREGHDGQRRLTRSWFGSLVDEPD